MSLTHSKISIIIPVCNTEEYLAQCLDSVIGQTLKEIEIICVDDASTDGSRVILEEYSLKDSRIRTYYFKSRKSALVARKIGVEKATGKYIMFMDSDDYLDRCACQELYEKIHKENVDILHFSSEILNCSGVSESRIQSNREILKPYAHHLNGKSIFEHCFSKQRFGFTLWNKIFSAELCKKAVASMKDNYMPKAQDMYMFFILAYYANSYLGWRSKPYYYYCFGRGVTGKNSIDINTFERYCMQCKVVEALQEFAAEENCWSDCERVIDKYCQNWKNECIELWRNKIAEPDNLMAFDILLRCWGKNIIADIAKKHWYAREAIAKKVLGYKADLMQKKKIRTIAIYYYHLTVGGIQRVISLLIPVFRELGYKVVLVTDIAASENDIISSENIERVTINSYLETNSGNYLLRMVDWENIVKEYEIDIVLYNAWTSPMLLWDILTLKVNDIPTIVQTHSVFSYALTSFNRDFAVIPRILTLADGIVTLSSVDKTFWAHYNRRVAYIPNPIDPALTLANRSKGDNDIIIWIGRFSNEKRPWEGIEIAKKVFASHPHAKLFMVGNATNPDVLEKYKNQIEKAELSGKIILWGFQKNVYPFLEQSKVLIMTSIYEGYSMTLLEAQAHGIPAVIYEMPYLELAKAENGVISVAQNDKEGAAREIVHLFNDDSYWHAKSDEAYNGFSRGICFDYASAWDDVLHANWPDISISDSSKIMMDTILDHYMLGWNRSNQTLRDAQKGRYPKSWIIGTIIWFVRKVVGGIRCYQEHGKEYTWNRVKYHFANMTRR